jgi:hypothetical protein
MSDFELHIEIEIRRIDDSLEDLLSQSRHEILSHGWNGRRL